MFSSSDGSSSGAVGTGTSGAVRPPGRGATVGGNRPLEGALGCQLGLDVGGVQVDVLLTGQEHEVVHDLVGDGAQHVAVLVAGRCSARSRGAHR